MIEWLKSLTPELITAFTACIAAVGSLMGTIIMFFMGRHQHKATIRASVAAAKDAWIKNFSDKLSEFMASSPAFLRYQRIKDEERMYAELSKCSCLLNQLQLMLDPNEPQHNDLIQMLIRTNPIRLSQKDSNEYADYYPKIFNAAWTILTAKRKELFKGE